jgi:hypothetical protein
MRGSMRRTDSHALKSTGAAHLHVLAHALEAPAASTWSGARNPNGDETLFSSQPREQPRQLVGAPRPKTTAYTMGSRQAPRARIHRQLPLRS